MLPLGCLRSSCAHPHRRQLEPRSPRTERVVPAEPRAARERVLGRGELSRQRRAPKWGRSNDVRRFVTPFGEMTEGQLHTLMFAGISGYLVRGRRPADRSKLAGPVGGAGSATAGRCQLTPHRSDRVVARAADHSRPPKRDVVVAGTAHGDAGRADPEAVVSAPSIDSVEAPSTVSTSFA
jgi:hypothetical protein